MKTMGQRAIGSARVALVAVMVASASAWAQPNGSSRQLFDRGLREYELGRYPEAIQILEEGYRLDPRPEFLFALGQAQRLNGNCRAALALYRSYLRKELDERKTAKALAHIKMCEDALAHERGEPAA